VKGKDVAGGNGMAGGMGNRGGGEGGEGWRTDKARGREERRHCRSLRG
jgi:hypothetical protein